MPPLVLGSWYSFYTVLVMCAHHFRHPYTLCIKIYNISMIIQSLKIMPMCGFYWHSRYNMWISTFILTTTVWFTGSSCGQHVPNVIRCHNNCLILSFINSKTHVYAYFYIFLLDFWYVTSTREMALIGSINPGYGTDACLHYTSESAELFVNFIEFLWHLLNFMKYYDAWGFFLNDNWTAMKNCTLRAINF